MLFLLLSIISYHDFKERRIPLVYIGIGIFTWMIYTISLIRKGILLYKDVWIWDTGTAIMIIGICFLLRFFWKDAIGLGDIWLLGMATLLGGAKEMIVVYFLSCMVFALYCLILLILGHSKKETLPFAPFVWLGYGCVHFIF